MNIDYNSLINECTFSTARSGGKGGQNVNKVETKAILKFDINASEVLSDDDKRIILDRLSNRINKDGIFQLSSEDSRSQLSNKKAVINRFTTMIKEALKTDKPRRATKPTYSSIRRRLESKKKLSDKKRFRSGKDFY